MTYFFKDLFCLCIHFNIKNKKSFNIVNRTRNLQIFCVQNNCQLSVTSFTESSEPHEDIDIGVIFYVIVIAIFSSEFIDLNYE